MKSAQTSNLVFLDIETSGLDVDKHSIMELAAIVTNDKFVEQARIHLLVYNDELVFEDEVYRMHNCSGLLDEVFTGSNIQQAADDFYKFLSRFGTEPKSLVLAGNCVHFDRKFIDRFMPKCAELFHHRLLDVSAIRLWLSLIVGQKPLAKPTSRHRAVKDIEDCIDELKNYSSLISINTDTFGC